MIDTHCANCVTSLRRTPLYDSLSIENYEVRMLSFIRRSPATGVECILRKHSLVYNTPAYVALSYCWGDENIREDITVNGHVVSVTANLGKALWDLYGVVGSGRWVWVDALCINQADKQERGFQVRLMTQVYTKASLVYAWVGETGAEGVRSSMRTLKRFTENDGLSTDPLLRPASLYLQDALLSVFDSPLWRRRWVIQELATASDIDVLCGTARIPWDILRNIYQECSSSSLWLKDEDITAGAYIDILELRSIYQSSSALSLCEAILRTRKHLSKDPRDRVYALLGITSDGPTLVPTPNYSQDVGEMCAELTRSILVTRGDLDIILIGPMMRSASRRRPTWSPNWCSSRLPSTVLEYEGKTRKLCPAVMSRAYSRDGSLRVEGMMVGVIADLTSSFKYHEHSVFKTDSRTRRRHEHLCEQYYGSRLRVAMSFSKVLLYPKPNKRSANHVILLGRWLFLWILNSVETISSYSTLYKEYKTWTHANRFILRHRWAILECVLSNSCSILFLVLLVVTCLPLLSFVIATVYTRREISERNTVSMLVAFDITFAVLLTILVFYLIAGIRRGRTLLARSMKSFDRLCVLGNGAIGHTCAASRPGDLVCYVAGCSTGIVLRAVKIGDHMKYRLVGSGEVVLKDAHRGRYRVLTSADFRHRSRSSSKNDAEYLASYQREDWWRMFDLI